MRCGSPARKSPTPQKYPAARLRASSGRVRSNVNDQSLEPLPASMSSSPVGSLTLACTTNPWSRPMSRANFNCVSPMPLCGSVSTNDGAGTSPNAIEELALGPRVATAVGQPECRMPAVDEIVEHTAADAVVRHLDPERPAARKPVRQRQVRAHGLAVEHQQVVACHREPIVIGHLGRHAEPGADRHRVPRRQPEHRDERIQIAHVQRLGHLRRR